MIRSFLADWRLAFSQTKKDEALPVNAIDGLLAVQLVYEEKILLLGV